MLLQSGGIIKAPNFVLPDQDGKKHELWSYRGSYVLLYFYPKDNTPGCTKEACSIRDEYGEYKKENIRVLGVSADSVASHSNFSKKNNLPFPLLSDPKRKVIKSYGAMRATGSTLRVSYLISPNGDIIKSYPKVDVAKHAKNVLEDIRQVENETTDSDLEA